jgi:hypothetical protein
MSALARAALAAALALLLLPVALAGPAPDPAAPISPSPPSALARQDIPGQDLAILQTAAATCPGLSWTVLAGIAKVESDFGRTPLPGVRSGTNPAGARGPFQFEPGTWTRYGSGDVYDFADAAFAAARDLCANGGGDPARLLQAVFAYNHAWWYVREVVGWAGRYEAPGGSAWLGVAGALHGATGAIRVIGRRVAPLFPWVPARGFPDSFAAGQCTYYAAFQHLVTWNGNATGWWTGARAAGAAESSTPSLGAIAVWRAGPAYGPYGHVGLVIAVGGDAFTVEEMNFVGVGTIDQRVVSLTDSGLDGFIE